MLKQAFCCRQWVIPHFSQSSYIITSHGFGPSVLCRVCPGGRNHGMHKEQGGKRPHYEVPSRELHDGRPQRHRRGSDGSLRAGSHSAAAEPGPLVFVGKHGRELQPLNDAIWGIFICHDSLRRGVIVLHRSSVQLLLRGCFKWVLLQCIGLEVYPWVFVNDPDILHSAVVDL